MKTITLGFGYTQNIGEHESWKVYQEVQVEPDENPDDVFAQLKDRVKDMLLRPDEMRNAQQELVKASEKKEELNRELEELNTKIRHLRSKYRNAAYGWENMIRPNWEQAKAILEANGLEIPELPSIEPLEFGSKL